MKNLHVANTNKFVQPYIKFINQYFDSDDHHFALIINDNIDRFDSSYSNVKYFKNDHSIIKMLKLLYKNDRIYLHSLFNWKIVAILYMQPWLLKKCSWIIWGGDLYRYRNKNHTIFNKIYEKMRKVIIKNMGRLLPIVEGDFQLAKRWYGVKGPYKIARYNNMERNKYINYLAELKIKDSEKININVGNSATPSNHHIEVLQMLEKYKNEDIKIHCPLSYGDMDYANKVKEYGERIFGRKFVSLDHMMDIKSYLDHLKSMDIGIFNNDRQQGLGNISSLLFLGKKIYLKADTTMWDYYSNDNLKFWDIESIKHEEFNEFISIDDKDKEKNYISMKERYSDEYRVKIWQDIFNQKF